MDLSVWLTFFAAAWAISLSIGPGAVAAMSAGLSHGFARGYFITFGLVLGMLTQLLIVGLGLGALITTSGLAFGVIKWAGVAYLLWLGIAQWRAPVVPLQQPAGPDGPEPAAALVSRRQLVLRGWIVNAVNPKGTVFTLAVVPQFLDPAHPLLAQYAAIGATLVFTDLVVMGGYILLAARILGALRSPRQARWVQRVFGSVLIGMAALLASFKRSA
jgi:homoserine/homoserine lactone efflux protein